MPSKDLVPVRHRLVDNALVEDAVSFINEKLNASVYTTYEEIGLYILDTFFDGDMEQASSRNPKKLTSYNALCRHENLAINKARLSLMVRVANQEKFFSSHKLKTGSLSYTQKAELCKLPDGDEKIDMVKQLVKKETSTRHTARLVAQTRKSLKSPAPEKSPIEVILELLSPLEYDFENMINLAESDELVEQWRTLSESRRDYHLKRVHGMIQVARIWTRILEKLERKMTEDP